MRSCLNGEQAGRSEALKSAILEDTSGLDVRLLRQSPNVDALHVEGEDVSLF
jgi:hypothetical protein